MTVRNILISQQPPKANSPYSDITAKYGVKFDFVPFFSIEPLSSREFRAQRVNILDYTAVVFSARSTIDAFFHLCNELRVKVPETMKYFCTTEAVAMYLQKHIVYRKRKIFFGDGTVSSLITLIGSKHKGEKFLIATSDSTNNDVTRVFEENGLDFKSAIFVKSVSRDLKTISPSEYDMIVLYNPSDVKSLYENFPDFRQNGIKFVSYGKSVVKAMADAGIDIEISAPTSAAPSVAKAIELRNFRYCFLENNGLPYSRIMVSVSKRFFKRAVKRNLLKRRIRESYRLQKDVLPDGKGADILFIYNSKEVTDSRTVSAAVRQILTDIGNEIRKK